MANLPDPLPVPTAADEGRHEYYFWQIVWDCLPRRKPGQEFRTQLKIAGLEAFERWYLPVLTESELRTWFWCRGRTLGWAKLCEIIPNKHFLEGIQDRNGELLHVACGIKKPQTIRASIVELERQRLLTTFPAKPTASGYTSRAFMPFDRTLFVAALNLMQWHRSDPHEGWLWKAVVSHHLIDPHKRKVADLLLGRGATQAAVDASWLDWCATEDAHETKSMIAPQVAGLSWDKSFEDVAESWRWCQKGESTRVIEGARW